jgi:polyhydroxyalkanoate synthesis regulator phasin
MGVLDFTWNAIQSDQIDDIEDKVKALEKDMETARAWIEHLTKRIEALENERKTETTGGTG